MTFALYLVTDKAREPILTGQTSPWKVRNVAQRLKERPGRKVEITRDNKVLPGGKNALDRLCLDLWFEEREETT